MLSGFTIVRNAVSLDYPIVPALRSILEICDEVIVNVGQSADGTRDLVAAVDDPRVRIIDSVWDFSRGSGVLALETERAMRACRGVWGLYIQADEVLHETGAAILQERVQACGTDPRVEGLLVDYRHFYGDFDTVATNRHWYRSEVRCVRLDRDIRSYQDAQGFRVGSALRRVRARLGQRAAARRDGGLEWTPLLRRFEGTHPRVAQDWIAARRCLPAAPVVAPRRLRLGHLRLYASDWIERLTGARVFEYRNYVEV